MTRGSWTIRDLEFVDWPPTVKALIMWTHLSLNIFSTVSQIDTEFSYLSLDSKFLDSKINDKNPVKIGYIVLEKSDQKSVHRIYAYTVFFHQKLKSFTVLDDILTYLYCSCRCAPSTIDVDMWGTMSPLFHYISLRDYRLLFSSTYLKAGQFLSNPQL